jgi:hypothetical protein
LMVEGIATMSAAPPECIQAGARDGGRHGSRSV